MADDKLARADAVVPAETFEKALKTPPMAPPPKVQLPVTYIGNNVEARVNATNFAYVADTLQAVIAKSEADKTLAEKVQTAMQAKLARLEAMLAEMQRVAEVTEEKMQSLRSELVPAATEEVFESKLVAGTGLFVGSGMSVGVDEYADPDTILVQREEYERLKKLEQRTTALGYSTPLAPKGELLTKEDIAKLAYGDAWEREWKK